MNIFRKHGFYTELFVQNCCGLSLVKKFSNFKWQAELRSAVFLAIEGNRDALEMDPNQFSNRSAFSMVYHFLRQNRFLATAAVFEKEIRQVICSD